MKLYKKPALTCYERITIGHHGQSPSNSSSLCQVDCNSLVCDLVATSWTPACIGCDAANTCNEGVNPLPFPVGDC